VTRSRCPGCRQTIQTATSTDLRDRSAPRAGDVGICIACGQVMLFKDHGRVEAPSSQEQAELARDPDLRRAIQEFLDLAEDGA
jgi:RNase P subunit RPR2